MSSEEDSVKVAYIAMIAFPVVFGCFFILPNMFLYSEELLVI